MRKTLLMLVIVTTAINLVYWLVRDTPDHEAHTPRIVRLLDIPLTLDTQNQLVVDTQVRQLFDLLASRNNDEPVDQWKHKVLQPFAKKLPAPALACLQDAFDRYVEFNLALQLLPMEGAPNLQAVLQRVQELRSHYLGVYAEPMYADWGALETFTSDYLAIMTQQRDDRAARRQLEKLSSQLPQAVQARARNMIRHSAEDFAVDDMAALEPDAYARMLQELTAVSLIETSLLFDEPSSEFMAQYEQYSDQKRELLLTAPAEDKLIPALSALRHQFFQGSDILRAETLDRAEAY